MAARMGLAGDPRSRRGAAWPRIFAWDYGTKHGDIRVLGAASYLTPLLAAGLLVLAGRTEANWSLVMACLLITGGAVIAAADLLIAARGGPRTRQVQPD